eukprot:CAMPEP_0116893180 /NCGR_PEP_ID=MMETSP0467-20121206/3232_1 /TAXON_ID=283647 /ORGANISM="Mesodinium pulex, Strain SPMC105" /LENGTH=67 /DNA_ID=CAMNT_0004562709 /DNA_START=515 /DNA_END=715 /DNA_ORIENTATION=+
MTLSEVNQLGSKTLDSGTDLHNDDHPSFNDPEYRKRRQAITDLGKTYKMEDEFIPNVVYTDLEKQTW